MIVSLWNQHDLVRIARWAANDRRVYSGIYGIILIEVAAAMRNLTVDDRLNDWLFLAMTFANCRQQSTIKGG
jgi:hypothetical protein